MTALDEKIFDTKNVSDLPKDIAKKIKSKRFSKETYEMLSLFKIKESLTIDEILVGLYRKYKKENHRSWVSCTMYNLSKRGILRKLGIGEYKLVKNIEDL